MKDYIFLHLLLYEDVVKILTPKTEIFQKTFFKVNAVSAGKDPVENPKFAALKQAWKMNDQHEDLAGQQEDLPELFSKTLILIFAILFSVLFAAVLLVLNLRRLGKKTQALWVLLFTFGYLVLTALILQMTGLNASWTFVANVLGAAILNEFFWNKFIGRDLEYQRRGWIKPILIAILIAMLFFFLVLQLGQ